MSRLDQLTHRDGPWAGLRVLVTGLGVSGFAAADALLERGARVIVLDAGSDSAEQAERREILGILGARLLIGPEHVTGLPERPFEDSQADDRQDAGIDLVVTSPGWRPDHPVLAAAGAAGIPVWGDVELAWRMRPQGDTTRWLTVTGTNGKTTTVQLLTSMLTAAGLRTATVGNVGRPVLEAILDPEPYDVLAVELSSFQLHYLHSVSAVAACCLNVAPDHLDWHGSLEAYAADKAKIYERTQLACVYNVDDPATEAMVAQAEVVDGCRAIGFTQDVPGLSMLGVVDGVLADRAFVADRRVAAAELGSVSDLRAAASGVLPGSSHGEGQVDGALDALPDSPSDLVVPPHLIANALAAAALARAVGVPPAAVRQGLRGFRMDAHRTTDLGLIDGVRYVDDSKATNPHAAAAALRAFPDIVWVAGGQLKGAEVEELVKTAAARLRGVVLFGQDRDRIEAALRRHAPDVPVVSLAFDHTGHMSPRGHSGTSLPHEALHRVMDEVVAAARELARPGDVVLLAPAAASLDMFPSYGTRGEMFAAAVARLTGRS